MAAPFLRLGGCINHGDHIEGLTSITAAEFFTVYLMDREGLAHALVDRDTFSDGMDTLRELAWRAKLEPRLCPFLEAEAVM